MDDPIAVYLAKGGKIRKIDADDSSGMSSRDWRAAVRGEQPAHGSDDWLREMGFVQEAQHRARGY